ncbi:MAG: hypothetical protein KIT68_12725 [Phycisphaeraceae bacterium]|nr:hypothetical protein [Phycisphaeraceae bacterium]
MTSCRSFADLELLHPSSARAPTRRRPDTPTRLPYPRSTLDPFPEVFMNTAVLVASPRVSPRKPMTVAMLLATIVLGLGAAFPGYALDLVAFTGITGPLTSALTQLADLGPGIKALVGFIGFVVALISLSALRNFGPVLFYVGLAIFAAVGLVIAGAIMGAVI